MNKKLQSLDILKGIGIIMIIIVHNRHFIMKSPNIYWQLINYGQMGCQLFFLVSGMALCYSWFRQTPGQNCIRRYTGFVLRRYLRLFPGFLIILVTNFLLNLLLIDALHYSPGFIMNREPLAILTNILFLHGFFPDYINAVFPGGWYIGTTFLLYLLFPVLAALFERLHARGKYLILILPALLLGINVLVTIQISRMSGGSLYPSNNSFLYYFFPNQLPCFALGILLYFQENRTPGSFCLRCPLPVSIGLFLLTGFVAVRLFVLPETPYIYTVIPSVSGLSFYWLAVSLIHVEHRHAQRPARKKGRDDIVLDKFVCFLAHCGQNSYGMYLMHGFVSWYGIKAITATLNNHLYAYNDLRLYLLLLIPSVFIVYVMGLYMEKLLAILSGHIKNCRFFS